MVKVSRRILLNISNRPLYTVWDISKAIGGLLCN